MKKNTLKQQKPDNGANSSTRGKDTADTADKFPKYFLSDKKYSYYLYGDDNAVAFCYKDNNPKFWNGHRWVEHNSFLEFCDKSVEISFRTFKTTAIQQGAVFEQDDESSK